MQKSLNRVWGVLYIFVHLISKEIYPVVMIDNTYLNMC